MFGSTITVNGDAFRGKTVICIGANAGIGLAMCDYLTQNGVSRLIMGCRSLERGEAARREVLQSGSKAAVEVWQIDLSSLASCRAFSQRWSAQPDEARTLDTLYLNAGLIAPNASMMSSEDGLEMTYACNVIGHLALIEGLLSPLSMSSDPRVIFTGSGGSKLTSVPEPPSQNPRTPLRDSWAVCGYVANSFQIYCDTKLLLTMVVRELQQSLDTHPIEAYRNVWIGVFHPGLVYTTIADKQHYGVSTLITSPINYLVSCVGRTPAQGAEPGLYLGTEVLEKLPRGTYWSEKAAPDYVSRQNENEELRRLYFERCVKDAQVNPAVFNL